MRRRRYSYSPPPVLATEADRAVSKQVVIAKITRGFYTDDRFMQTLGPWAREGDVCAFYLDIVRSRPKVTVVVLGLDAPASVRKTELFAATQTDWMDDQCVPVIQFRGLVFYRRVDKMKEWLEGADPQDETEMLHFIALFERHVQMGIQRRTLDITPKRETQWRRYGAVRTLYLQPGTAGEKQAAGMAVMKVARAFLNLNGTAKEA